MTNNSRSTARAVADVSAGRILATVEIQAPPERVFRALTSDEVTHWWGSDDTYRTTGFVADVRVGGAWRAEGKSVEGQPFVVQGEYLELEPPRRIVQTWKPDWDSGVTTITYQIDATALGTRVTVHHEGFAGRPDSCQGHSVGWERVLGWLSRHFPPSAPQAARYYLCRLLPPRPSFPFDMSADERAVMQTHVAYWTQKLAEGVAIVFGPVADPAGPWGLGVIRVADEAALAAMTANDPALTSGLGFSYQTVPMLNAVFRE